MVLHSAAKPRVECGPGRVLSASPGRIRSVDKTFMLIGAVAAFLAVGFGAFGVHGLRGRLSPEMMAVFESAVRYHMYHALALVLVSLVLGRMNGWLIHTAGWCFVAGIVLFSGSLYLLALS